MNFQEKVASTANIVELVTSANNLAEVCELLGYSNNGRNTKVLRQYLDVENIDYSHFIPWGISHLPKYARENRTCPVCKSAFSVNLNNSKDAKKLTCSKSCANSYFRTGTTAGNYIHGSNSYRTLVKNNCIKLGVPFACIVCGFDEIVEIHHADEDHTNNDLDNLVPMCPNHHKVWHKNYSDAIMEKIVEYQNILSFV